MWVPGGQPPPGLEPVEGRGAGKWSSGGSCGTGMARPEIMLIESKYRSQLHLSSTIVRDFLFLR